MDYLVTNNGKLQFKSFLPLPEESEDGSTAPEVYFDCYEEVEDFGITAYVVDAANVYFDSKEYIERFNKRYNKQFSNFAEVFDYAVSEDPDDIENPGLGFSASIVEDAKLTF